jgi:hypothetical protein
MELKSHRPPFYRLNLPRPIFLQLAPVKSTVRRIARRRPNGNSNDVGGKGKEMPGARSGSESGFAGNENGKIYAIVDFNV